MRINQIAREHNLSNREVIDYLASIGISGKSHSSSVDDETREKILVHFGRKDGPVEEEKPKTNRFKRLKRPRGWKPKPKVEKVEEEEVAAKEMPTVAPEEPKVEKEVETPPVTPTVAAEEAPPVVEPTPEPKPEEPEVIEPVEAEAKPVEAEPAEEAPPTAVEERAPKESGQEVAPKPPVEKPKKAPTEEIILGTPEEAARRAWDREKAKEKERGRWKTDDAIRKEIQKLKLKKKRPMVEEEVARVAEPRRGRGAPKGKTKKAWKRSKRERQEAQLAEERQRQEQAKTTLKVHEATTVADVASGLDIPAVELISKLVQLGVMATVNQRLDYDTIQIIADEFGFKVEQADLFDAELFSHLEETTEISEADLKPRPPVVTVMGHVDHGKTKLLDAIRSSDVASGEAGGITQHIGAYHVSTPRGDIVFVDTPGHEAFTSMRARGAMVTDIVVLVVAADDGVMPQTIEAIHHAKAAGVPIIVAVNKIDLAGANPDRVKQQLGEQGLVPEEWSGETMFVQCSALKHQGIDDLLEHILLQAEMLELKANPNTRARGAVLEAKVEQGRGVVTTVLVQQGTLCVGDACITGVYSGRVRAMHSDRGEPIESAGPSMPVEILGLNDVPASGDPFVVVPEDSQAKQISNRLQQIQRERELRRTRRVTFEDLHAQIEQGEIKELNLIIKGDVQGSVEALRSNLESIASDKVKLNIIHSGAGAVSESDVMLASASNALVLGFNVEPTVRAEELGRQENVQIRTYRVIYDAIASIRDAMTGLLEKDYAENVLGRGEVREVFRTSKGFSIAGSYVRDGHLTRNAHIRILRDSVVVHEGRLASLRRFKEDVREVGQGMECGIGVERFNDIRVGDVVECYELEEVAPTL